MAQLLPLAHVVNGLPETGWQVLGLWSWDWLLVLPLALGLWYALGMRRCRTLKPRQPLLFYTGLACLALALSSPIGTLADDLFFMHTAQHLLLIFIAPPLLLLSAPAVPLLRAIPRTARKAVLTPIRRNPQLRAVFRLVTFPPIVWLLFVINLWYWHFAAGAYETALRHSGVHVLEHAAFLLTASLFWMVLIDPRPLRSRLPYGLRMVFTAVSLIANMVLGAGITFRDDLLYPFYAGGFVRGEFHAGGPEWWGFSAYGDQQLAGLMMWIVGDVANAVTLSAILLVWLRKEEEERRREEARADAAAAAAGPQPAGRPYQRMAHLPYWREPR